MYFASMIKKLPIYFSISQAYLQGLPLHQLHPHS